MPGTRFAARHVVEIEHALDLEWNVPLALDKRQVAARIHDPRQFDQPAFTQRGH